MKYSRPEDHLDELHACLSGGQLIVRGDGQLNEAEFLDYGRDRTRAFRADYEVLCFVSSTEELAKIVRCCNRHRIAITPSGGRTGLCGGAVAAGGELVISMARMNRLLDWNPYLPAITVEAGMLTANAQCEAEKRGLLFPLDLAASGSSQVGGNLATNAGGTRMISLGSLRSAVTGLTAVTGAGEVVRFPGQILKNNTGFDLSSLFIGSEGSLGLITEATVRLAPQPGDEQTVLLAVETFTDALAVLAGLRAAGVPLLRFEYFDDMSHRQVVCHLELSDLRKSFYAGHSDFVVLSWDASQLPLEDFAGVITGPEIGSSVQASIIADSSARAAEIWAYREGISESLNNRAPCLHKQDISLPAHQMDKFLHRLRDRLSEHAGRVQLAVFGHLGDGNLHLNFFSDPGGDPSPKDVETFSRTIDHIDAEFLELIANLGGSISAEHGIGLLKTAHLRLNRSDVEIEIMRGLKRAFDPLGILNPGKVLPPISK